MFLQFYIIWLFQMKTKKADFLFDSLKTGLLLSWTFYRISLWDGILTWHYNAHSSLLSEFFKNSFACVHHFYACFSFITLNDSLQAFLGTNVCYQIFIRRDSVSRWTLLPDFFLSLICIFALQANSSRAEFHPGVIQLSHK